MSLMNSVRIILYNLVSNSRWMIKPRSKLNFLNFKVTTFPYSTKNGSDFWLPSSRRLRCFGSASDLILNNYLVFLLLNPNT